MNENINIMDKAIVLNLNGNWMPIGHKTVKKAITDLCGGEGGKDVPSLALDIEYPRLENGEYDFENPTYMNPVKWEDWVKLPIRDYDMVIHGVNYQVRVPTVIIAHKFHEMPMRKFHPTKQNIWNRDHGICQYSGQKLSKGEATVDHIVPKSKGGKNSFTNLVLCHKDINLMKGDRFNNEVGLKLIRQPKEPMPIPVNTLIVEARHADWNHFIMKKNK